MAIDYSTVTEVPGNRVTREQLARVYHRYRFASDFCKDKEVLEVGCGAGLGLGYLARSASRVVGGDYTEKLVQSARRYYKDRIRLYELDAHRLPFGDRCFDVVILYEAIYYLQNPRQFVEEAHRVLRKGGVLLIATVNKDWAEFNPSPYSIHYFSVPELAGLLQDNGFGIECYGAFSSLSQGIKEKMIASIRRIAVSLHLVPKTMKGKEFLKEVFYGNLLTLDAEIEDGMCEYEPPVDIPYHTSDSEHKIIYAVGHLS